MNKKIIYQYEDALAVEQSTECEIQQLHASGTVFDKVRGSNPDFPYNAQSFSVTGIPDRELRSEREKVLQEKLRNARRTRIDAEKVINGAPFRMQRIIDLRIIHRYSWSEVAEIMRAKSGESVRAEFRRWLNE